MLLVKAKLVVLLVKVKLAPGGKKQIICSKDFGNAQDETFSFVPVIVPPTINDAQVENDLK